MIVKSKSLKTFRTLDRYLFKSQGAIIIDTNMAGSNTAERSAEAAALRAARPDLAKAVGHIMVSHDPGSPDLSIEEWTSAVRIACVAHELRGAPFVAVLHRDRRHSHVHVAFVRVRADRSLVSDSYSYRKNLLAARHIEKTLQLRRVHPALPTATRLLNSDDVDGEPESSHDDYPRDR